MQVHLTWACRTNHLVLALLVSVPYVVVLWGCSGVPHLGLSSHCSVRFCFPTCDVWESERATNPRSKHEHRNDPMRHLCGRHRVHDKHGGLHSNDSSAARLNRQAHMCVKPWGERKRPPDNHRSGGRRAPRGTLANATSPSRNGS